MPAGEITYKRQRLGELEKLIGIHPISLSYHPLMALMETVFVRDYPEERLAGEYEKLATNLMAQVGDDAQRLAAESGVLWNEKKDLAGAIACALRVASQVPELGVTLLGTLGRPFQEFDGKGVPEMTQLYAVLSRNAGTRVGALQRWGLALISRATMKGGEEAAQLLQQAREKLLEAERLRPGIAAPNLAYLEAIEGNTSEVIRWLQIGKTAGERISRAMIAGEDFDRIRNDPEFVLLMQSLPEN